MRSLHTPRTQLFQSLSRAVVFDREGGNTLTEHDEDGMQLITRRLTDRPQHASDECATPLVRGATLSRGGITMGDGPGRFGVLLQRYRAAAGLSQEELAERAGLSRRGISDLERGKRTAPYPATVRRLGDTRRAVIVLSNTVAQVDAAANELLVSFAH